MIRSIQDFSLRLVDRRVGEAFYGEFGLLAREEEDRTLLFCPGRSKPQIRLSQGIQFKFESYSFGVDRDSATAITASLAAHPSFRSCTGAEGLFEDPDGNLLAVVEEHDDEAETRPWLYNNPGVPLRLGRRGVPSHLAEPPAPRRLARIGLFSPDPARLAEAYVGALGLVIAARLDDRAIYLGSAHGGDHHLIELHRAEGPGLHHVALEANHLDEIAVARRSMIANGRRPVWGMGRSSVNGELFLYGRDPWNGLIALVVDGDHVDEGVRPERGLEGISHIWSLDDGPPPDFLRRWTFLHEDGHAS